MSNKRFVKSYLPAILRYGSLSRHPLLKRLDGPAASTVAKRILSAPEIGFCYFRMPKAGSSTVLKTVGYNIHKKEVPSRFVQRKYHRLPSLDELRSTFTFTMVRHPETRVLSAFLDKSPSESFQRKHPFLAYDPGTRRGFMYFLDALEDGALNLDAHWCPQATMLPFPPEYVDFVGRFENFESDLQYAMAQIFQHPTAIKSHRPHMTGANDLADHFINKATSSRIRRLYGLDFERFYPNG